MLESAIQFPAVCFASGSAWVARGWQEVRTTTRKGLQSGRFNDLLIVDSQGMAARFKGADEVGKEPRPAWAPRLSFSRWIEVEPRPVGPPESITVDELRRRTLKSFAEWHGWQASGGLEIMKRAVEEASTPQEIVRALAG